MAIINLKEKTIQVKIVYCGPGRSGKTTNLEFIYGRLLESQGESTSKLTSINTKGDRTLFFDFFPISLGKIAGFELKIQLYTTPGQVKYESTRRLVLKGVDGVVFVADSLKSRKDANIESLQNLMDDLKFHQMTLEDISLVFQWNKRDLDGNIIPLTSVEDMESQMNSTFKMKSFPCSATTGVNVLKTVKHISKMTMESIILNTLSKL
jgi:signal recognition particle receptor subunit beta